MGTTERESSKPVAQGSTTLEARRQPVEHPGYVVGILVAALVINELVKDIAFSADRGEWLPLYEFGFCSLIAGLPFLLAKIAPKVASFEIQWWPKLWRHWAWFAGMVCLLFLMKVLLATLAVAVAGRFPSRPVIGPVTPTGIVLVGIAGVLIAPIAEEIFFRGYVLEQLRKLTRSTVALVVQAFLFGLFHVYTRGVFTSHAVFDSVNAFFVGMILGVWRIKLRSFLPIVLAHVLINSTLIVPLKARYDQITGKSDPIQHTVSEQTTRITQPLRPDGSVDYVAALNERQHQGVTPENNAAVLFWKAVGPEEIQPEYRTKYFGMLGIRPLRRRGDYFVTLDNFVDRRLSAAEASDVEAKAAARYDAANRLNLARQRPWSPAEFPLLAEWLAANEKPLALLIEASKHPRRFDPLCCRARTSLISVPLPANLIHRDVAEALCARATWRLSEGKPEEAWNDLLACHRLARLAGQCATTIEASTAFTVEETACDGDRALLQHTQLRAVQIASMRQDLDRLPPMPRMVDKLDAAERFTYLDVLSDYSRHGMKAATELYDVLMLFDDDEFVELDNHDELKNTVSSLIQYGDRTAIDWDLILRMGNSWYDRIVEAYRMPTVAEQRRALRRIDEDLRRLKKTAANAESLDELLLDNPEEAFSERLGQVLLTFFMHDPQHYLRIENRGTMRFELSRLGFALTAYHADRHAYPEKLADLVPTYLAKVPDDIFTGSGLHYRREGKGYLLYSVGINGKNDGAKGYDDRKNLEDWDDLVIRVPAPAE